MPHEFFLKDAFLNLIFDTNLRHQYILQLHKCGSHHDKNRIILLY